MKINNKIYAITTALVLVLSSCTNGFEETNTNPNSISGDKLDGSFAGPAFANALYKGLHHGAYTGSDDDHGTYGLITMLHSMLFVQYQSATSTGWATERNGINDGWRDRGWLRFYTLAVPALNTAYKASEGNAEATAVLDIWKVFMFHQMTDQWGSIPYTQAGSGLESVAYDSQEAMYTDFFNLLEKANATLSASSATSVGIFVNSDDIFKGDIQNWRAFGNSLRLRLALRISDIDAAKAKIQAEAAVAAGVMETNAQSATYKVSIATDNNFNKIAIPWGFRMSASMESILRGYSDPRMQVWFTTSKNGGLYRGQPNGGGTVRNWSDDDVSTVNPAIYADELRTTKNIEVIMAAECFFNRAEGVLNGWNMGGGTAKAYYESGIKASMEQWNVTNATVISDYISGSSTPIAPYLASEYAAAGLSTTPPVTVPVAWASSVADQRKQITVQKYLGLFPESWEAWADLRRTDANILYPLLNTENTDPGVGRGLLKRLTYLPNEYSTNGNAVLAAISGLGGADVGGTKVWWDTK